MEITIHNVELSSRVFLKWKYTQNSSGRKTKISASADAPIHDDLRDAIQGLVPHFVLITEMKKKPEVAKIIDLKQIDEDLLSQYRVTGVSKEDNKGDISYRITGTKFLKNGKSINFDTPKVKEMAPEDDKYDFITELIAQVDMVHEEVLEYMDGKEGSTNQTSMDFGDDFDPDAIEEVEEADKLEETAA